MMRSDVMRGNTEAQMSKYLASKAEYKKCNYFRIISTLFGYVLLLLDSKSIDGLIEATVAMETQKMWILHETIASL